MKAEARSAFGLTVLREHIGRLISYYGNEVPAVATGFAQGVLSGGPYTQNGKQFFAIVIDLHKINTDGSKDTNTAGITAIP
jgi:hypothetical protein